MEDIDSLLESDLSVEMDALDEKTKGLLLAIFNAAKETGRTTIRFLLDDYAKKEGFASVEEARTQAEKSAYIISQLADVKYYNGKRIGLFRPLYAYGVVDDHMFFLLVREFIGSLRFIDYIKKNRKKGKGSAK